MSRYPQPDEQSLSALKRAVRRRILLDTLLPGREEGEPEPQKVSAAALYAYATGRRHAPDLAIERALRSDPAIRGCYVRLLRRTSTAFSSVAVAASDAAFPERAVGGHRLSVEVTNGRYFLVIRLGTESASPPSAVAAIDAASGLHERLALPRPVRGIVQLRLAPDSILLQLLRNPASVLSLC